MKRLIILLSLFAAAACQEGLLAPDSKDVSPESINHRVLSNEEDPRLSPIPESLSSDPVGGLYISGDDYVSQYLDHVYTLHGYSGDPEQIIWSCSDDLRITHRNGYSITVCGNLKPEEYVSLDAEVSVEYPVTTAKHISSVWKPGYYIDKGYITGNNGYYFLVHYPSVGTYPGASGYLWGSEDQSCTITEQHDMTVRAFKNPAFSQGRLSVMFNDPFSYVVVVSDQIQ